MVLLALVALLLLFDTDGPRDARGDLLATEVEDLEEGYVPSWEVPQPITDGLIVGVSFDGPEPFEPRCRTALSPERRPQWGDLVVAATSLPPSDASSLLLTELRSLAEGHVPETLDRVESAEDLGLSEVVMVRSILRRHVLRPRDVDVGQMVSFLRAWPRSVFAPWVWSMVVDYSDRPEDAARHVELAFEGGARPVAALVAWQAACQPVILKHLATSSLFRGAGLIGRDDPFPRLAIGIELWRRDPQQGTRIVDDAMSDIRRLHLCAKDPLDEVPIARTTTTVTYEIGNHQTCKGVFSAVSEWAAELGQRPPEGTWVEDDLAIRAALEPCRAVACGQAAWFRKTASDPWEKIGRSSSWKNEGDSSVSPSFARCVLESLQQVHLAVPGSVLVGVSGTKGCPR